jgi:hypothetical protein
MLPEVAVVTTEGLRAVRGVVGGIDVQDDLRRRLAARAHEQFSQVVVEDLQALGLGSPDFEQPRAVLPEGVRHRGA